ILAHHAIRTCLYRAYAERKPPAGALPTQSQRKPPAGGSADTDTIAKEQTMPDLTSLAASLGALLKAQGHTVAVAESAAGGVISAALVAVPGASAYYLGGGVIYTQASRRGILHLPDEAYAGMRASTEPYALLNARTIRDHLGATWGLAETG